MSDAPKKVFILENDEYVEITNEEHCKRKADDNLPKDFVYHSRMYIRRKQEYLKK